MFVDRSARLPAQTKIEEDMKKMKMMRAVCIVAMVSAFVIPAVAFGQSGCTDSPENPTALLALVGGLGGAVSMLRSRLRKK